MNGELAKESPGTIPAAAPPAAPCAAPALADMRRLPALGILTLLTLAGAFLRFWRLDYQSFWLDEGYTLTRIQGSMQGMLQSLANQGFPPLWYFTLRGWCLFLEWLTGNGAWAFSPAGTRLLPALFGVLTVPALYFLARQWLGRRGSLVVTLLAAVNPFLIYYARDIKMYAPFWFFVVLNMAIFFRSMTSHRHWFWFLPFALTGACMTGLHSMAWFILGLQLLFLLTRPRLRGWDAPAWLLGAGLTTLLPIYWFLFYLQPAKWMARVTAEQAAGLSWMTRYTDMNAHTLLGLPTSHILGFLWPEYPPTDKIIGWYELGDDFSQNLSTRSWEWMATAQWWSAGSLFAILLLGLLPWDRLFGWKDRSLGLGNGRRGGPNGVTRGRAWWLAVWILLPTVLLACTWISIDSPWYTRIWQGFNPKPLWEPRYLGILLPAWLIWLAWSLGRLPTRPLRWLAIAAVTAVCTWSSLSNHLVYRNAPYLHAGEVAEQFINRARPGSYAIGMPTSPFYYTAEDAAYPWVRRVRPGGPDDTLLGSRAWTTLTTPDTSRRWLRSMSQRSDIDTLVLTDRYGDLSAEPLGDAPLAAMLGPGWKLVHSDSYRWHYEWRYYLFHTWRTRVWKKLPPPSPETTPAPPAGPKP